MITQNNSEIINNTDRRKQLKYDLIGKDSYRGVTLSYAWLANQTGHFCLGFVPALLVFTVLKSVNHNISKSALWAGFGVSIFWICFETYNVVKPLFFSGNNKQNYVFKPDLKNIIYDTITDLKYFAVGAFCCAILCHFSWLSFAIIIGLILSLITPSKYWYTTKMFQQIPQYPFQFRLSQWNGNLSESNKKAIHSFLENNDTCNHLLISGADKSGKTSMAIGIGNEYSIRNNTCSYTTAIKLFSLFYQPLKNEKDIWFWRNASLLIIDDINPGLPLPKKDIINTVDFEDRLNTNFVETNKQDLRNKKVIWVLGNADSSSKKKADWSIFLTDVLEVAPHQISTINLSDI